VRGGPDEVSYRRALALISLLVVLVAAAWAVLTPVFRAPDEPQHVNSVLRLAYGGGWPPAGEAPISSVVDRAREQAALDTDVPGRPLDRPDHEAFVDVAPVPDDERVFVDADGVRSPASADVQAGADESDVVDQMTQHPPLYYAVGAVVLRAVGLAEARWDGQLLALRLMDALLLLPVPVLAAAAVRRLTGSRAAALVAASFTLFVPQVGHILGSVTNDSLAVLSGAVATFACVLVVRGDLRTRTAIGLGAAVGVGLLTKVMAVFALPMIVGAYLMAPGSRARRSSGALIAGGVSFAVGGWWWLRNVVVYGVVQPVGIPERFEPGEHQGTWYFVRTAVTQLTRSFFGNFGWLEVRIPDPIFWSASSAVAALIVIAFVRRDDARRALSVVLLLPTGLWLGVLVNAWPEYAETGIIVAVQGRYLFAGLVGLASGAAVGASALLGPRLGRAVPWVVAAGCTAAVAGLAYGFWGFYEGPGQSVADAATRWAGWSPLTGAQLVLVGVLVSAVGVAALVAAVRFARATSRTARSASPEDAATAPAASTPTTAAGSGSSE
jgi:4-amino-4-deoxy-L-arabinose transferase-like glycosyltransferase